MPEPDVSPNHEAVVINQIQLVLSEKRTALSFMRTGIAVFALPLSVLSFLIATSSYYDFATVMYLVVPLLTICTGLAILAFYLVFRALIKIRHYDRMIAKIKEEHTSIAKLID
jgi:O-antigen ligase